MRLRHWSVCLDYKIIFLPPSVIYCVMSNLSRLGRLQCQRLYENQMRSDLKVENISGIFFSIVATYNGLDSSCNNEFCIWGRPYITIVLPAYKFPSLYWDGALALRLRGWVCQWFSIGTHYPLNICSEFYASESRILKFCLKWVTGGYSVPLWNRNCWLQISMPLGQICIIISLRSNQSYSKS